MQLNLFLKQRALKPLCNSTQRVLLELQLKHEVVNAIGKASFHEEIPSDYRQEHPRKNRNAALL